MCVCVCSESAAIVDEQPWLQQEFTHVVDTYQRRCVVCVSLSLFVNAAMMVCECACMCVASV